jgi:acyl carrier protein
MDDIAQDCMKALAQAKGLPLEAVAPEKTLDELGLDSLDRVSLSFDLEEKYNVEIPESRLTAIRTVGDLIAEVEAAVQKKDSAAAVRP